MREGEGGSSQSVSALFFWFWIFLSNLKSSVSSLSLPLVGSSSVFSSSPPKIIAGTYIHIHIYIYIVLYMLHAADYRLLVHTYL
jgi:hypothetical protein